MKQQVQEVIKLFNRKYASRLWIISNDVRLTIAGDTFVVRSATTPRYHVVLRSEKVFNSHVDLIFDIKNFEKLLGTYSQNHLDLSQKGEYLIIRSVRAETTYRGTKPEDYTGLDLVRPKRKVSQVTENNSTQQDLIPWDSKKHLYNLIERLPDPKVKLAEKMLQAILED